MDWLKATFWEIKQSSALKWFGFLLGLSHLLTFFTWASTGHPPLGYYADSAPLCWSFFEDCASLRVLSLGQMTLVYYTYPVLAAIATIMFVSNRLYGVGWFFLTLAFFFKSLLYFNDARLSHNAHYLLFLAHAVFLFAPQKKSILKYLLVSFFVASGILKLNTEWMSGVWLTQHTGFHPKFAEWVAALTALAELILPWMLVSRKSQNIVVGFLGLLGLSIGYWFISDSIGPAVQVLFVLFYPFYYFEQRRNEMEYLYQSYIRPEASQAWIPIVILAFWTLQALPFAKHVNPAMASVSQNLALEGHPTHQDCQQTTFAIFANEVREVDLGDPKGRPERLQCDPFMRFLDVKNLCRKLAEESGFQNVASSFSLRTLNDKDYRRIFESDDLCNKKVNYRNLEQVGWNRTKAD